MATDRGRCKGPKCGPTESAWPAYAMGAAAALPQPADRTRTSGIVHWTAASGSARGEDRGGIARAALANGIVNVGDFIQAATWVGTHA